MMCASLGKVVLCVCYPLLIEQKLANLDLS